MFVRMYVKMDQINGRTRRKGKKEEMLKGKRKEIGMEIRERNRGGAKQR